VLPVLTYHKYAPLRFSKPPFSPHPGGFLNEL
jgi:hypothetical protein